VNTGSTVIICKNCGAESGDGARFCASCGERLEVVESRRTRKIVTALFCDVTGSTALGEELDPEVLRDVINRYFAELRTTIEKHGGTVEKFIGDAVMAVFGIPRVEEDDALRAVRAAAEIRDRIPAVAQETGIVLRFRTGVNTGPVLAGEGENLATGDAVNVAARLEQAAAPGEIVLGAETLRLVRDAVEVEPLEPLELKGKSEAVPAFRLLSVDPGASGIARHLGAPLVGRQRELGVLRQAWTRTVEESGCHLFTLLGPAGVGKSRLVAELFADVGERATVLTGRCLHYGEGITFWPMIEALTPLGERAQAVLEGLSSGGAATAEELFWSVRGLLEAVAAERPVILHVDDVQWAEPTLVDLLDHVVDLSRGTPILVLCTSRPELLEGRPGWGGGKLNATTMLLEPLGAAESEALLGQLGDGLEADARARVIVASGGNPLFLEEMAALARERGSVEVPPTIQALLAARLERLAIEERELLERGAVEGEVFHRLAVRALASDRLASAVEPRLDGLVRKELIRPHPATWPGDDAFRFRHLLIRDAAYDGLPKGARADLHERFAVWLQERTTDLLELDEIVGWHLEQTIRYRRELGRAVEPALARKAAECLHRAGQRAYQRSDPPAARNMFGRALKLVAEPDPLYAVICVDLAEELVDVGELPRADALLRIAEGNPDVAPIAQLPRLELMHLVRPAEATQAIEAELPGLLARFSEAGDERGLAKAHLLAWSMHWLMSQATPAREAAERAAEHARRAGDRGLEARALSLTLPPLVRGKYHASELAAQLDLFEAMDPGPYLMARVVLGRGWLALLEGRYADGIACARQAINDYQALGMTFMSAASRQVWAEIELASGNAKTAQTLLLESDAATAVIGERSYRSTRQALLALAAEALGDRAAAQAAIELSDELSAPEDVVNAAITHPIRARMALANGDAEEAERWARSAVHYAFITDFPQSRAEAKLELARVLRSLGHPDEAATEARDALELYELKGDRPGTTLARTLLDELAA
jgi:class 3 adenylate cyclase/tetratricopeptide (TPR) repeat protein